MDIFEQVAQMQLAEAREEGMQEGERIANEKAVRKLLNETEFSDEKTAELASVTVDQVSAIRK